VTAASAPPRSAIRPSLEEVRVLARDHDLVPVVSELLADCDTPVSAFLRLQAREGAFLLESVEGGERLARYSFLGGEPLLTITLDGGVAVIRDENGERSEPYTDPLAVVERETERRRVAAVAGLDAPFLGGAIGFLAYEAARCFERLPLPAKDPLGVPHGWFGVVDTLIVFDHVMHRMLLVTHARIRDGAGGAGETADGADVDAAYAAAVARLEDLRERLRRPLPPPAPVEPDEGVEHAAPADLDSVSSLSRADFMHAVERCREYILAGDIFQVQISRRFALPLRAGAFDVYRALRSVNPSPYMFFLDTPAGAVVAASPEMLVRVTGRHVDYHPIAGTRKRGRTPERDAELEQELRASEKERAEHLMLVDLGRNDVGRVCSTGSVRVRELMSVERYSHVMHLVSHIEGELAAGLRAGDALRAAFPAGTVTGAPKIRAMEIIAELEPECRGVYSGAAGYLDFRGNLDTAIALRTLLVRDGVAYLQAAAGIVADSTPQEEALEIDNKIAAPLAAVERANAGLS
jgi:anthranilate synthase component 1